MHPILFHLGPITLKSFGLLVAIAMLVGIAIAKKRAMREGIPPEKIESLSFWLIVASLLGSRFLYTFVEHADHFWRHPVEFLYFHTGGLSFLGGLFFAVATAIVFCRKNSLRFWQVADLMAPSIAIGLAIGKVGCFLAGCCHGKVCDLPWGVTFHDPEGLARPLNVPLHPTQLYEALSWTFLFVLLLAFQRIRKFYGEQFLLFVIVFSIVRSYLETFRGDPGHLGTLTTAQFLSIPMALAAIGIWIMIRRGRLSSLASA